MSFDDRLEIEAGLKQQLSFKAISEVIGIMNKNSV